MSGTQTGKKVDDLTSKLFSKLEEATLDSKDDLGSYKELIGLTGEDGEDPFDILNISDPSKDRNYSDLTTFAKKHVGFKDGLSLPRSLKREGRLSSKRRRNRRNRNGLSKNGNRFSARLKTRTEPS